jgi:type 1 glutamine amidotransferase/sugar phosphate isomerase/epimerase
MKMKIRGFDFLVVVVAAVGALELHAQTPGVASRGSSAVATPHTAPGSGGSTSLRPADSRRVRTEVQALLGWRVGIPGAVFRQLSFSEAAGMADALGLGHIEGYSSEKVSPEISRNLDYNLSPADIAVVRERLNELRLKMTAYHVETLSSNDSARRRTFEFAKALGVETIVSPLDTPSLAAADQLANEFGINMAIEIRGNASAVMNAIESRGNRIGVSADIGDWMERGTRPLEGLAMLKDRLMVVHLRDRTALGARAMDAALGSGVADLEHFLFEIARQAPAPQEQPDKCSNCSRPYGGTKPLFIALDAKLYDAVDQFGTGGSGLTFAELWKSAEGFEKAVRPAMGYRVELDSKLIPITSTDRIPADERLKIEAALPKQALAKPKKPRKLLVVDLCPAGAYYHNTAAHANLALQLMARNTGAFEPVFSNDLNNMKYPHILQYDAVFLNSSDGELFADPDVLSGLMRFVREGGGLAGIHGASYASMDLPEFGELMGAADGPHRVEQATLKVDDPDSPITRGFHGKGFDYVDEFYHFLPTGPYSRDKLHVLVSLDAQKSDLSQWHVRPDNDYGLVWIKSYGKGRVFNCAMGHTPTLFANQALAEMILGGVQFVLGDLNADTTPSALLK